MRERQLTLGSLIGLVSLVLSVGAGSMGPEDGRRGGVKSARGQNAAGMAHGLNSGSGEIPSVTSNKHSWSSQEVAELNRFLTPEIRNEYQEFARTHGRLALNCQGLEHCPEAARRSVPRRETFRASLSRPTLFPELVQQCMMASQRGESAPNAKK